MAWNQLLHRWRDIPRRILCPLPQLHWDIRTNWHSIGFSMALYYWLLDLPTRRPHGVAALYQTKLPLPAAIHQLLCLSNWVNIVSHRINLFHTCAQDGRTRSGAVYNRISCNRVLAGVEDLQGTSAGGKNFQAIAAGGRKWILCGSICWFGRSHVLHWHFLVLSCGRSSWLHDSCSNSLYIWRAFLLRLWNLHAEEILSLASE